MNNLLPSKKQHALLEFIDTFIKEHDYAPSYREVARALDYKSVSTVATHINGLIKRGWLVKRDNEKRSVEVVYKKEGQSSPAQSITPALPEPPEAWLQKLVTQTLAANHTAEDIETLRHALELLGLGDLMPTLEAPSSQQ